MATTGIWLCQCKQTHLAFAEIKRRHYVHNRRSVGRQLHYLILEGGDVIGIISGASAVWACSARDGFFQIDFRNRIEKIAGIINNVLFRLERNERNLASRVLKLWRERVVSDWFDKYGIRAIGFETFVQPPLRGTCYKADNWTEVGRTYGSAKRCRGIRRKPSFREKTEPKLVFCRWVKEPN